MCIWIATSQNSYFVTVDEYTEDVEKNTGDDFVYRIYTKEEYAEKIAAVADNDIPLISYVSELGAEVEWNNNTVVISYNEKIVSIDIDSKTIIYDDGNELPIDAPGGSTHFSVKDSEIYVDYDFASEIVKQVNQEIR